MIREAADVGHKGVAKILDIMAEQGLAAPRTDKTNLPVNETLEVQAHKRARFMGPGGLNLKRLTSETGVQVCTEFPITLFMGFHHVFCFGSSPALPWQ